MEVRKLLSERVSAGARHHELLPYTHLVMKACKERKDKATGTPVKLLKTNDVRLKVTVKAHVAERSDLREPVASLTNDMESKTWSCKLCQAW